jgi:hypothetical protein
VQYLLISRAGPAIAGTLITKELQMKRPFLIFILSALMIAAPMQALADETIDLLKEAITLLEAGDFTEGREVVAIALDQIDHHLLDATAEAFPLKIGLFTRGEVQSQNTMGIELTECTYRNEQGQEVEVQLMGGGGGVFGNIAALGMNAAGGRKIRIAGRSGSSIEDSGETTITLKLKNGKSLLFKSRDLDLEGVTGVAEGFPVDEVDKPGS